MSTDVIISHVTFSSQELKLRLNQAWRFLALEEGKVLIHEEPIATIVKRGERVTLRPLGPRPLVRWVAWAIQEICPDAEAQDEEAEEGALDEAPLSSDEVEKMAQEIVATRNAAIAKEADPSGGAHEAVALVTYLVKRGKLELAGPTAEVARAVVPLLREVDDQIGAKLEDVLLDLDEVDELYADAGELAKIVVQNDHIFDR